MVLVLVLVLVPEPEPEPEPEPGREIVVAIAAVAREEAVEAPGRVLGPELEVPEAEVAVTRVRARKSTTYNQIRDLPID
ncbi:hypothetical protein KIH39_15410 [Telmatocola sphagniphila]|uniref:Uncharacterized protein n=1 Tax=Telmatocola sphagniphila TaxID=1123043 RepID=A0A8E6B1G5_9BACT|nr:hypothetical protein [Telmatocola sphagniphila]QVL30240.1 hypothetical protein KIH39_15410 [Telmatocola sphagniphila]